MAGLKTLVLDNAAASNALAPHLVEKLLAGVRESYADGTQTLVFSGEGKNFCAGFDLSRLDEESDADLLARFVRIEQLLQAVYLAPFDTVACAKGAAYGAGADLFAACRYRLAAPGTRFAMPGLQFGIVLGTRRLANLVGESTAYELLAASQPFDAQRALQVGFASAIAEESEWPEMLKARHESRRISGSALAGLARMTRNDSCADDMRALVESAAEPGLADRLRRYRDQVRSRSP
jgi:enoyl-CoA hydratase/carnithine racemase